MDEVVEVGADQLNIHVLRYGAENPVNVLR